MIEKLGWWALLIGVAVLVAMSLLSRCDNAEAERRRAAGDVLAQEAVEMKVEIARLQGALDAEREYRAQAEAHELETRRVYELALARADAERRLALVDLASSRQLSERFATGGPGAPTCDVVLSSCEAARESLARTVDEQQAALIASGENAEAARESARASRRVAALSDSVAVRESARADQWELAAGEYRAGLDAALSRRPPWLTVSASAAHIPTPSFEDGYRIGASASLRLGEVWVFGGASVNPRSGRVGPSFGIRRTLLRF